MILEVHLEGAIAYQVGDEIWQQSLADAIHAEAETIPDYAGPDLLEVADRAHRQQLRDRVVAAMTSALVNAGDQYRGPTAFCTPCGTSPRGILAATQIP